MLEIRRTGGTNINKKGDVTQSILRARSSCYPLGMQEKMRKRQGYLWITNYRNHWAEGMDERK